MKPKIIVKEVPIEGALEVHATITEFDEPYPKERFEEEYKGKEKLVTVAFIDNQPVGYMVSYDKFGDGSVYCWMTGVSPNFRRKGALTALMSYLERWAKKKGYNKIKIKTRNKLREMLACLIKSGFYFTEVIPYPNAEESRLFLEKKI